MSHRVASFGSAARLLGLLGLLTLASAAGCSSSSGAGSGSQLTGKVTFNSQAVAGTLTFTGADNKETSAPINADGTYQITLPGKGDYTVLVKAPASGINKGPTAPPAKDAPALPSGAPDPTKAQQGVSPPTKYAQPGNGLKVTITGGTQTYDIDLTK